MKKINLYYAAGACFGVCIFMSIIDLFFVDTYKGATIVACIIAATFVATPILFIIQIIKSIVSWFKGSDSNKTRNATSIADISTNNQQEKSSYPITLYENCNISTEPPYKVLKFPEGIYVQVVDLFCRRFFDFQSLPLNGTYSVALFRLKPEEVSWIPSNIDKFENLVKKLYKNIPADRFVKALEVSPENETPPRDLIIRSLCETIDEEDIPKPDFLNMILIDNLKVTIDTEMIKRFMSGFENGSAEQDYLFKADAFKLVGNSPVISLYEDDILMQNYTAEAAENEDFTGKFAYISVIVGMFDKQALTPYVRLECYISDKSDLEKRSSADNGYRLEAYIPRCAGEDAEKARLELKGKDLEYKGLRIQGYITPNHIRSIGVCSQCGKTFAFNTYNLSMAQSTPCYSDDGTDTLQLSAYEDDIIGNEEWSYTDNDKTFKYFNSFKCPYCGEAYIDYENNHEMKNLSVLGCVLVNREIYRME